MNVNALKSKIVLRGMSINEFAEKMGLSKNSVYRKLKGTTSFTREEIERAIEVLELKTHEAMEIFFNQKVS